MPLADALIASGTSIQKLRERGHAEVVDIPNAVDADRFRSQTSDFRRKWGIGTAAFVALYVARFQAFKNHRMLLEAFARFARGRPDARLVLAGSETSAVAPGYLAGAVDAAEAAVITLRARLAAARMTDAG